MQQLRPAHSARVCPCMSSMSWNKASPCTATFARVCLESSGNEYIIHFVKASTCNGLPCAAARIDKSVRLPISVIVQARSAALSYTTSETVALLPSGLNNGSAHTKPLRNPAHLLYDHVLLEADLLRADPNISVVLGPSHEADRLNVVHTARRELFSRAQFWPHACSVCCFRRLHTYRWSCDRTLKRYGIGRSGGGSNRSEALQAHTQATDELQTLQLLREALQRHQHDPQHDPLHGRGTSHRQQLEQPPTTSDRPVRRRRIMLVYGRIDADRRRLVNVTAHHAALQRQYGHIWRVVLWDDVWSQRPSIAQQLALLAETRCLITPHGAFPSVWALFLQAGSVLIEIMSLCFPFSWVPRHISSALSIKHFTLTSWNLKGKDGHGLRFIDPRTGRPATERLTCRFESDPDILIPPDRLVRALQSKLARVHPESELERLGQA